MENIKKSKLSFEKVAILDSPFYIEGHTKAGRHSQNKSKNISPDSGDRNQTNAYLVILENKCFTEMSDFLPEILVFPHFH